MGTKIAFAGDWHGNAVWAKDAINHARAKGADTLVHLGDYGYNFTENYRKYVELALVENGLELQFIDGNHENFTWLNAQPLNADGRRRISPRVHHLPRGYRWQVDGLTFLAVGGAHSVDRHHRTLDKSWWLGEMITDADIAAATAGGRVDVLVSHDCPTGVDIPGLEDGPLYFPAAALEAAEEHRKRLREIVDVVQPRMIWHGHYHVHYMTRADLGYGPVMVYGLDCDGSRLRTNIMVVDTADVVDAVLQLRAQAS